MHSLCCKICCHLFQALMSDFKYTDKLKGFYFINIVAVRSALCVYQNAAQSIFYVLKARIVTLKEQNLSFDKTALIAI